MKAVMKTKKRYFVVNDNLEETAKKLDGKKYLQLADVGDIPTKILIDSKKKHYWMIEQKLFENTVKIIANRDQDIVHVLEPETLETL
jgi:hypothetical protein